MSTLAPPRTIEPRQILTLPNVTWEQYVTICDALPDRPGLRTAFDGDTFELMTTSHTHEFYKKFLGRLFEMLTFELDIDIHCGGETTFRREDLEKGLEPDQCYWIAHEAVMRHLRQWNPECDPPPDLAIEIDVTSSSVKRESIYASLGVPELWRFNGSSLRPYELDESETYSPVETSIAIPGFDPGDLMPFVLRMDGDAENAILRDFIDWINETLR